MTDRPCPLCSAKLAPGIALCGGCMQRCRNGLRSIPGLLAELDVTISKQTPKTDTSGAGICPVGCLHRPEDIACRAPVRMAYNVAASNAALAITTAVHGWVRVWDEETPAWASVLAAQRRARALRSIPGQCGLLAGARLAGRPWVASLARDVQQVTTAGWTAVDRPPDAQFVGRCPKPCDVPLYVPTDAAAARCRACGRTWSVADVRAVLIAAGDSARAKVLPKADIARLVGIPVGTLHRWSSEGRIEPATISPEGRPMYLLGPIADAVRAGVPPERPARRVDALTSSEAP